MLENTEKRLILHIRSARGFNKKSLMELRAKKYG